MEGRLWEQRTDGLGVNPGRLADVTYVHGERERGVEGEAALICQAFHLLSCLSINFLVMRDDVFPAFPVGGTHDVYVCVGLCAVPFEIY